MGVNLYFFCQITKYKASFSEWCILAVLTLIIYIVHINMESVCFLYWLFKANTRNKNEVALIHIIYCFWMTYLWLCLVVQLMSGFIISQPNNANHVFVLYNTSHVCLCSIFHNPPPPPQKNCNATPKIESSLSKHKLSKHKLVILTHRQ